MSKRRSLSSYDRRRQRKSLRKRQGDLCVYCSVTMLFVEDGLNGVETELELKKHPLLATIDHKTPLSRGGKKTLDNLCLCCQRCNFTKDQKTEEEFRK